MVLVQEIGQNTLNHRAEVRREIVNVHIHIYVYTYTMYTTYYFTETGTHEFRTEIDPRV